MNFMQKKIFCFITSLALILSCFAPFRAFAAAKEILAAFEYTAPAETKSGAALRVRQRYEFQGVGMIILQREIPTSAKS